MTDRAPIVLFAFNRPEQLRETLEALRANPEARETPLFVYVDGPRNEEDAEKVASVLYIAKTAKGFSSVDTVVSESNKGLGPSIIQGVSEVIGKYGRAIVMEDDLVVTPSFLAYMNSGLERFEKEDRVFSICGYSLDLHLKDYPYDTYWGRRSSSWGWATWKDRWESVDWNPSEEQIILNGKEFNRWGGSDCKAMLLDWRRGKNKSWAIRFCFSQFLQDKISLFPLRSLVNPDAGFTGEGTNCKKFSRFHHIMEDREKVIFSYPETKEPDPVILRNTLKYHSLGRRIWSRIMYLIYR